MFSMIAPLVAAALSWPANNAPLPATAGFSLEARILSVMEGGPLVVKVTLRYRGPKPIDIHCAPREELEEPLGFCPPKQWAERAQPSVSDVLLVGILRPPGDRWSPGESRVRLYDLHHKYGRIPAGPTRLRIEWPIYAPGKRIVKDMGGINVTYCVPGHFLAKPVTTITFKVPRATPANLRKLREQLERELAACARLPEGGDHGNNPRHQQAERLAETLRYCPHEALFPLVLKLIALPDSELNLHRLIDQVYDVSSSPQKAHALFCDYLSSPDPVHATTVFAFWGALPRNTAMMWRSLPRPQKLPAEAVRFVLHLCSDRGRLECFLSEYKASRRILPKTEIQRLKQARNIWVRALRWVTFPRHCERPWVEGLKADLRRLNRPLPAAEFNRLLSQLDSPRFAVRERAAAQLLHVGDGVVPALRDVLKRRPSLELRRRIERLLEDINAGRFDPLRDETLNFLASRQTPEARAVLQMLAEGLPQARLTKAAAAALKPPKEYRPPQNNLSGQPRLPPGLTPLPRPNPPKDKPFPSKERP